MPPVPKKSKTGLAARLNAAGASAPAPRSAPVWEGPLSVGEQGGVTFSLLSRFLCCRERFRLMTVEGLRTDEGFNHKLEYGQIWHVCEEALASERGHFGEVVETTLWADNLKRYCKDLCLQHPTAREQVDKWYQVCKRQFPLYVDYWANHPDVVHREPLLQEQVFNVPYVLPSGRVVRLRGKWDSVDLVRDLDGRTAVWLQENKTKGDIYEPQMRRQLTFDLQTMMYRVALDLYDWTGDRRTTAIIKRPFPVKGVRYNVVRRPLSGGKGTIVQKKPTLGAKCSKCKGEGGACPKCGGAGRLGGQPGESREEYYDRVASYLRDNPQDYFMRWNVDVTKADVERFRVQCLDPILEQLCMWWEHITWCRESGQLPFGLVRMDGTFGCTDEVPQWIHWRHPFGVWNVLDEGGSSDMDGYLADGSEVGLRRVDNLFPELT